MLVLILEEKLDENAINVCKQIGIAYGLGLGKTLTEARTLVANGFIEFNIYKPVRSNGCGDLGVGKIVSMWELFYVVN